MMFNQANCRSQSLICGTARVRGRFSLSQRHELDGHLGPPRSRSDLPSGTIFVVHEVSYHLLAEPVSAREACSDRPLIGGGVKRVGASFTKQARHRNEELRIRHRNEELRILSSFRRASSGAGARQRARNAPGADQRWPPTPIDPSRRAVVSVPFRFPVSRIRGERSFALR